MRKQKHSLTVARTCEFCGAAFMAEAYFVKIGNARFCSRSCMARDRYKGHSITRPCAQCGTPFTKDKNVVDAGNGRFCSRTCYALSQRVEAVDKRNYWEYKHWRKAVYQRDHYTCQSCGQRGGRLNAHHIQGWLHHPDLRFDLGNGVTLCTDCHMAIHRQSPITTGANDLTH